MNWIGPIYVAPIFLAIVGRIIWWVAFSQEEEDFLPSKDEGTWLAIIGWPLVVILFIGIAIGHVVVSPFIFIRKLRLKRQSHEQLRS